MGISLKHSKAGTALLATVVAGWAPLAAQAATPATGAKADATKTAKRDLTKDPTLYTVGYAHLDTEWRWEYPQVIAEYLPKTTHDNFALFEKYPDYVFNFSGANRYRLMKEYWPADYAEMAAYIKAGRWFPAGSSMEEGDVNAPSAEGIMRQFLYGNEYFQKEFGVTSKEYMLPDCFGFPWSLPSLLAHAGIKGFSTQKLVWGSSVPDDPTTPYHMDGKGIPFNFGIWLGPDGKGVVAALNPGSYSARVGADLSTAAATDSSAGRQFAQTWLARLQENQQQLGLDADYHYYGTGDTGGAPSDGSVNFIQQAVSHPDNPIRVLSSKADQFFLDLTPAEIAKLPKYSGEMELQNHSAGSLTSQAYQKRWIRENEVLADAAEKASVTAAWLGGRAYPMKRLNDAWMLMMGGHFHDIAAGTATPKSYEFAWNDDIIAMNQMSGVIESGTEAVASALNTQTKFTPIVVFNPLNIPREDVVDVTVPSGVAASDVSVTGPDGKLVPAQLESVGLGTSRVLFLAKVPAVGYAVYDVAALSPTSLDSSRQTTTPLARPTLQVTPQRLDNARYRVEIDANGDVATIWDKKLNKELLASPIRLALLHDDPAQWPAWNMDFSDEQAAPRGYVGGIPKITVTENGPVRVAVTVERTVDSSIFVQTISLAAGDAGNRVEFGNVIDWHMPVTALKATFALTASDSVATYNWDVGTIKRATEYDRKFEVPSHQWIDLTDRSGTFGATILTDDKNGSDKLNDSTIRLTLIRTPGMKGGYEDQSSQDFGHHEFTFGIAGHGGDYRAGQTDWQAWRLNTPLMAFASPKHAGALGKEFSLLKVSDPRVRVLAVKRAEASDEIVVRIVELDGLRHPNVRLTFAAPVTAAREVNGQEQPIGTASVVDGSVVTTLTPFSLRTFAVRIAPPAASLAAPRSAPVALAYDRAVTSDHGTVAVCSDLCPKVGFTDKGEDLPAEMLPAKIGYAGIQFTLGPMKAGTPNAVTAQGQTINLPAGKWTRLYVLAASADGDQPATFRAGSGATDVVVQDWGGYVGQWDYRTMKRVPAPPPTPEQVAAAQRAQAQRDSVRRVRIDSALKAGGDTSRVPGGRGGGRGNQGPRMIDAMDHLSPGYIKPAAIAWYASHKHTAVAASQFYSYSYLFAYPIDVPPGATTLTLPNNDKIRIMAITVSDEGKRVVPAHPLHDTLGRTAP